MKKLLKKIRTFLDAHDTKIGKAFLVLSGIALVASFLDFSPFSFDLAWISIILCGIPIVKGASVALVTEFDIKADVLVSLALIASVAIGENFAAGEVAFIMQLGAFLEETTVKKARAGIEKLVRLAPETARIIEKGGERIVPARQVKIGDRLRVLPGETIPVDGKILGGTTSINQAVLTGESLPVDKGVGDEVFSGTINQFGTFEMEATKVGEDSSIQRMVRLVQSADASKAKIVNFADRAATWIVVTALSASALTWIFTGEIIRAVTILVVFCPCALVLATPTAIMAAIGNATRHGFLVRVGDALERLASVCRITFDKTGTLTVGTPTVVSVKSFCNHLEDDRLYAICAAAEKCSEHPLGKAIVKCYLEKFGNLDVSAEDFRMIPGNGIRARIEGAEVRAGNSEYLEKNGIDISPEGKSFALKYLSKGATAIYIATDGKFVGFIALSDFLKGNAQDAIDALESQGIRTALLTGDSSEAAKAIASEAHIDEIHANFRPENKLEQIAAYQETGERVCMIGDGINDAPALKKANVGIAMGGIGSDIAIEAADIVQENDDIGELPHLTALSRRMMKTIKVNIAFSMGLNFFAVILAINGTLGPVVGALVHNGGSFLVIMNSALLLTWKRRGNKFSS